MGINRRDFLKFATIASVIQPALLLANSSNSSIAGNISNVLSCYDNPQGEHFFALYNWQKGKLKSFSLEERGHGICLSPNKQSCAAFARRPGTHIWIIDTEEPYIRHKINSPSHRHFYGHGVYELSGRYLFASENNVENGDGYIAVFDCHNNYQRINEFKSYGIGPHEIQFLSDGKTLVVANGGIQTHPDLGRSKLNIPTMQPNLAYIDTTTGKLIDKYMPPEKWHKLSIRHIAVSPQDTVSIAMQYQGAKNHRPALLAMHSGQSQLQLIKAPEKIQKKMKNYCGSICYDQSGEYFAMSSPRGDLVTLWDKNGQYLHHLDAKDGCGLAPGNSKGEILLSTGRGELIQHFASKNKTFIHENQSINTRWDNHMSISG